MTVNICKNCQENFLTEKSWATLCKNCFWITMQSRLCSYCGNEFWTERHRPSVWPCKHCKDELLVHLIERPDKVTQQTSINQDLLKDLIFLAHPDKHENSDKATRATQQLLEMRKQKGVT